MFYKEEFKNHELTTLVENNKIQAYRVAAPNSSIMSFYLTFLPCGIGISGDITPNRNGVWSSKSYDKDWFLKRRSPDYLCEKFLEKVFIIDNAVEEILDLELSVDKEEDRQYIIAELKGGEMSEEKLYDELSSLLGIYDYFGIGYDYDDVEKEILVSIQYKFKELYEKYEIECKVST